MFCMEWENKPLHMSLTHTCGHIITRRKIIKWDCFLSKWCKQYQQPECKPQQLMSGASWPGKNTEGKTTRILLGSKFSKQCQHLLLLLKHDLQCLQMLLLRLLLLLLFLDDFEHFLLQLILLLCQQGAFCLLFFFATQALLFSTKYPFWLFPPTPPMHHEWIFFVLMNYLQCFVFFSMSPPYFPWLSFEFLLQKLCLALLSFCYWLNVSGLLPPWHKFPPTYQFLSAQDLYSLPVPRL